MRHTRAAASHASSLALVAALIATLGASSALAAPPPRVVGTLTDQTGVLDSCRDAITGAQRSLADATDTELFIVYVESTDGMDMSEYVNAIEDGSDGQITPTDAVFAVATGDRQFQLHTGDGLRDRIGAAEQDDLVAEHVLPALRASDWCAAATGAITAVSAALTETPPQSGGGGGGIPGWLLLLVAVLVVAGIVLFIWRRRSASPQERALQEDLGKQATSLLIQTDDLLRATEQEVGFAEAQFGEAQAAPYRGALDQAKAKLREAFTISQQLDDETPETPEQRREMLQGVIDRANEAQQLVHDQAARVKGLRDLVKNVDQVLPQTTASVQGQVDRIEAARATIAELGQRYQAENIGAIKGNPDAARQKLAGATAALAAGQAALASADRDTAVIRVQEAETAIAEAKALLDAVEATKVDLASGESELQASIAAVDQDIAQARAAIAGGTATERSAEVDRAAGLLATARQAASAAPIDVVAATRAVTEANTAIDAVLAGIQEANAATQRNAATAQAALTNAAASVSQARGLLEAYGASAAGRRASTRVAEAQQYLARAQALLPTDPATAAQAAQTADALADEAIAEMQASGVGGQMQWGNTGGGGYYGGPPQAPSGGGGGDMLGSIIGGILGGMISGGGGGGRSSWSGGSGGFGGFGSGGFGGGGGSRSSSSRSSSSGTRRSSGGGGSRGGRRSGGGF